MRKKAVTKAVVYKWVRNRIASSNLWAKTTLTVVYNNQLPDEKLGAETKYTNLRGFTSYDAEDGTAYAKQILSGELLTFTETKTIRKIACRYWKQFVIHFGWEHVRHKFMEENGQLSFNFEDK